MMQQVPHRPHRMQHLHHRQAAVWEEEVRQVCQVGPISHIQAICKVRKEISSGESDEVIYSPVAQFRIQEF